MEQVSIYNKIENKGALEAEKIKEAGIKKAQLQMQEAVDAANRDIEILIKKTIVINNEKIKTKTTQSEQAAKKSILSIKKKIIDEVFNMALNKLQELDGESLFSFVLNLLSKDHLDGDEVLLVSQKDFPKYLKVFSSGKDKELDLLNKKLGKNYQLMIRESDYDFNGGFIVEGKTYDINHSYQAILTQVIENNEAQIAKDLFGKGN